MKLKIEVIQDEGDPEYYTIEGARSEEDAVLERIHSKGFELLCPG